MPRVPKWARKYREEVREFAALQSATDGVWRVGTFLGPGWFNGCTMRVRIGTSFARAQAYCDVANENREASRLAVAAAREARLTKRRKGVDPT